MSFREVTMYQIVCDEPGCEYKTGDEYGAEYVAWAERFMAEEVWTDGECQATLDGKHYCEKHRKPECADCDATEELTNDATDGSGDWWCPWHLETQPEFKTPGVVV